MGCRIGEELCINHRSWRGSRDGGKGEVQPFNLVSSSLPLLSVCLSACLPASDVRFYSNEDTTRLHSDTSLWRRGGRSRGQKAPRCVVCVCCVCVLAAIFLLHLCISVYVLKVWISKRLFDKGKHRGFACVCYTPRP